MNLLGQDLNASILAKTALAVGDAWVTTDGGLDSEGNTANIGDALRATNTLAPSNWVSVGQVQGPQGIQGVKGDTGDTGADSTVPGPTGPDGADSTVPGPEGPVSTVPGPQGDPGADGADSTVPGPTGPEGPVSTVPGPTGPEGPVSTVPGPEGPDGPEGPVSTTPGPAGNDGAPASADVDPIVIKVAPGGSPDVTNTGTTQDAVFQFSVVTGDKGNAGVNGDTWIILAVDPTTEGKDGDLCLNNQTYDVFEKISGTWGQFGNLQGGTGPTGGEGPTGPEGPVSTTPGPEGPDGPTGPEGPTAVSSDAGNTAVLGNDSLLFVPAPVNPLKNDIFYENGQNVTVDYTLTAGKNAMSSGPITVDDGITVTVPDGANWSVV